jgi:hypothetical protein
MFLRIGLLVILTLTLPLPASAQITTLDQISAGDWTGTANALDGKFSGCTIKGPKATELLSNQLSFSERADGTISIWLEDLQLPPPKCTDGGFMGSGLCPPGDLGRPAPPSDAGPVDVSLGVGDGTLKDMKSYKGTQLFGNTVIVDLPPGDDLIDRMKTARYMNGVIPSLHTLFMANLGASLVPFWNSAAYTAIEVMNECAASHAK